MFVTKDHVRAEELEPRDIILSDGRFCIVLDKTVFTTAGVDMQLKIAPLGYVELTPQLRSLDNDLFVMRYQWED